MLPLAWVEGQPKPGSLSNGTVMVLSGYGKPYQAALIGSRKLKTFYPFAGVWIFQLRRDNLPTVQTAKALSKGYLVFARQSCKEQASTCGILKRLITFNRCSMWYGGAKSDYDLFSDEMGNSRFHTHAQPWAPSEAGGILKKKDNPLYCPFRLPNTRGFASAKLAAWLAGCQPDKQYLRCAAVCATTGQGINWDRATNEESPYRGLLRQCWRRSSKRRKPNSTKTASSMAAYHLNYYTEVKEKDRTHYEALQPAEDRWKSQRGTRKYPCLPQTRRRIRITEYGRDYGQDGKQKGRGFEGFHFHPNFVTHSRAICSQTGQRRRMCRSFSDADVSTINEFTLTLQGKRSVPSARLLDKVVGGYSKLSLFRLVRAKTRENT